MPRKRREKEPEVYLPIEIKPKTENQKKLVYAIDNYQVVLCTGPAGSGKTYISVAKAAESLMSGAVSKIVVTRPMVTAGEQMGFLPGDMKDKIDPFLMPVYNELDNVLPGRQSQRNKFLAENKIQILPIAFMRGVTIKNAFIIVDEAQNADWEQLKMIITRLAEDSFIIFNGDPAQSDLKMEKKWHFAEFAKKMKNVKGVGVVEMSNADVVRSRIVRDILEVLEKE